MLDQACRLRLIDRAVVESRVFEHLDHLPGEIVPLGGDVVDLRLVQRIGRVVPSDRATDPEIFQIILLRELTRVLVLRYGYPVQRAGLGKGPDCRITLQPRPQ